MTSTGPTNRDFPPSAPTDMESKGDFEIGATWLLLPLANYLAWALFAIVWWLGGFGLGRISLGDLGAVYLDLAGLLGLLGIFALAASLGSSFILYTIMNRVNLHSARAQILLLKTIEGLENRTGPRPSPAKFALNSAETNMQQFAHTGRERSSFLWALFAMIPFVGWIFVIAGQWVVSRDLMSHIRLESVVLEDVDRTMKAAGLQGLQPYTIQIRPRNGLALTAIVASLLELLSSIFFGLAGALILVYLTIGIVSLVWIDLSSRDPREHFRYHSAVEDDLARSLNSTLGPDGRPI